jgi:hypothetical protein
LSKSLSQAGRNEILDALEAAREAQAAFWDSLQHLEEVLGQDIDGNMDLSQIDLEALLTAKN